MGLRSMQDEVMRYGASLFHIKVARMGLRPDLSTPLSSVRKIRRFHGTSRPRKKIGTFMHWAGGPCHSQAFSDGSATIRTDRTLMSNRILTLVLCSLLFATSIRGQDQPPPTTEQAAAQQMRMTI